MRALIAPLLVALVVSGCGSSSSGGEGSGRSVAAHVSFPSERSDIVLTLRPDVTGPQMRDLLTERLIAIDGVTVVDGDYTSRSVHVTVRVDLTTAQRDALSQTLRTLPEVAGE